MEIKQFRYSADNLSYIIYNGDECAAIDGGAADEILDFVNNKNIKLKYVLNTHAHPDHTPGNSKLLNETEAEFITCEKLAEQKSFMLGAENIDILSTPGHTEDSITFHIRLENNKNALITGDTLFNGTVGTCFTGDLDGFLKSINLILKFSEDTLIYSGHDYVRANITFAKTIDPENNNFDEYLIKHDVSHVTSSLGDELKVNPYLRFNDPVMIEIMKKRNLPVESEIDRWNSIMHVY